MLTNYQSRLILSHLPHIGPILCERLSVAFSGNLSNVFTADLKTLKTISGIGPIVSEVLINWEKYVNLNAIENELKKEWLW
jgi:NAD-dependent DNA ligase